MDRIPLIDLKAQHRSIHAEVDAAMQQVIEATRFLGGTDGFESAFAEFCGAPYGVGTSSGTTALHLVLAALEVGPGDEVITVPNTFIATAEAITQTGAKPVFVDVDQERYNMNPAKLAEAVTDRTRVVIPVHLYGLIADMDPIMGIAEERGLTIVEDAAQAHGAEYNGKRAGQFGVAATFSFYPGKILGAYGDAGMVVSRDEGFSEKMRMLSNHGRLDKYRHRVPGYNYRMDGIQSAVLGVKLKRLESWIERRRALAGLYGKLLAGRGVGLPFEPNNARHVHTYYVVRVKNRSELQQRLGDEGVDTVIHYPLPLHMQPAYEDLGYREGDFPVAEGQAKEILSLPLYPELEEEQVRRIARLICEG